VPLDSECDLPHSVWGTPNSEWGIPSGAFREDPDSRCRAFCVLGSEWGFPLSEWGIPTSQWGIPNGALRADSDSRSSLCTRSPPMPRLSGGALCPNHCLPMPVQCNLTSMQLDLSLRVGIIYLIALPMPGDSKSRFRCLTSCASMLFDSKFRCRCLASCASLVAADLPWCVAGAVGIARPLGPSLTLLLAAPFCCSNFLVFSLPGRSHGLA
jgi:hypothetical protein